MAELADALDLGSSAERRAGSSPVPGTNCEVPRSARDFASSLPLHSRLLNVLTPVNDYDRDKQLD